LSRVNCRLAPVSAGATLKLLDQGVRVNKLFYGDNLDVLRRKVESGSVDLCYIDPPFNSKRNYFQIYNNQGGEDRAQAQAFVDTWEWGKEADDGIEWITLPEILRGDRLNLPMARADAVKSASEVGDADKQATLL